MIKTNPALKDSIDFADKVKMTTELADSYFMMDETTGEWKYTPYFADVNTITAFYLYCVDGLEFEPQRSEDGSVKEDEAGRPVMESVYDAVISDQALFRLYTEIAAAAQEEDRERYEAYEHKNLLTQFLSVLADVADMVEFRKQQILHQKRDSVDEFFGALTEAVKSVDFSKIDLAKLTEQMEGSKNEIEPVLGD